MPPPVPHGKRGGEERDTRYMMIRRTIAAFGLSKHMVTVELLLTVVLGVLLTVGALLLQSIVTVVQIQDWSRFRWLMLSLVNSACRRLSATRRHRTA